MRQNGADLLAQGFAKIIVQNWLQLDLINTKYELSLQRQTESKVFLPKIVNAYEQMEQQALFDQNNFYYEELDIDHSSEQTKQYVFQYYLSEQKSKILRQNPQLSINQIRIKAANNFRSLQPSQKIYYLKQYLKDNKYKSRLQKQANYKNNLQSQHQLFQNNYPFPSFNPFSSTEPMPLIPSLFDNENSNYSKREKEFISKENYYFDQALKDRIYEENQSHLKKPANTYHSNQNRQKNDPNKSGNQSNDKKAEEWKQKAQFQTLKSLFKRLQSHN